MSDLYRHLPFPISGEQGDNLLELARYLVRNSAAIDARAGLHFGFTSMKPFRPLPEDVVDGPTVSMPPLAYGPLAGIAALPDENWIDYCLRAFGVRFNKPFIHWVQDGFWHQTERSAVGAALRIAYVMDYGIPHDYRDIARGKAGTDYDDNGFLWDRLKMLPPGYEGGPFKPLRVWPPRKSG